MEGESSQSSAATLEFVTGCDPEVSRMHWETRQYCSEERKLEVSGVLAWEAAVTSEPVASAREKLPGVLLGTSISREWKAKSR